MRRQPCSRCTWGPCIGTKIFCRLCWCLLVEHLLCKSQAPSSCACVCVCVCVCVHVCVLKKDSFSFNLYFSFSNCSRCWNASRKSPFNEDASVHEVQLGHLHVQLVAIWRLVLHVRQAQSCQAGHCSLALRFLCFPMIFRSVYKF